MRKYISILILSFYLISTGGVFLRFHYCDGDLNSVSITDLTKPCGCEDSEDDCCSNEHFYLKIHTDQNTTTVFTVEKQFYSFDFQLPDIFHFRDTITISRYLTEHFDPPGLYKCPLIYHICKLTC